MIKIKSLHKYFGQAHILKNVNLTFLPGEIIGVVGANGAGKTTLFNCITGLDSCEGEIEFTNGKLKYVTGFLSATPYFMAKMTGLEYIKLFLHARNIKVDQIAKKNIFDLPLNRYAETYSTGMKKKLALTAILLQKNEVFILDEPFSGVDIQSNVLIKEILFKLKELNKIVVLSSHIFSTLYEVCDKLHYLNEGKIVKSVENKDFKLIEEEMKGKEFKHKINEISF